MAARRLPTGGFEAVEELTLGDGTKAFAERVVLTKADGSDANVGASGPQPAASSQSVTPASDGAAFPVTGTIPDASSDSGNTVKVGGIVSNIAATMTAGTRQSLMLSSQGQLRVQASLGDAGASPTTPTAGSVVILPAWRGGGTLTSAPLAALGYLWDGTNTRPQPGDTSGAYVVNKGGTNIATAQVALTTNAAQVVAARAGRQKVTISLTTAAAFYVGPSGVTAASGLFVPAGASITLDTAAAVFAVLPTGTATASAAELY